MKEPTVGRKWTEKEIYILQTEWAISSKERLTSVFNRPWKNIRNKAMALHLSGRAIKPYPAPFERLPTIVLTEIQKAQIAMMIDCEGHLIIKNGHRYAPTIGMTNTNKELIEYFKNIISQTKKIYMKKPRKDWKDSYVLEFGSMPLIFVLLQQIEPYLIIKKKHSILLREFIALQNDTTLNCQNRVEMKKYTERQHEIVKEIKELNRRGKI